MMLESFGAPRWLATLCAAAMAVQALLLLHFILTERPNRPAYAGRMTIDGLTYVRQARAMVAKGDTFYTPDAYHSVGMQVLTAQVFRVAGSRPVAVKVLNWLLWLAMLWMAWHAFARVLESRSAAWITTTLVASSVPLQRYCAIVQYEVFAGAVLIALLYLNVRDDRPFTAALSGVLTGLLATFRLHFAGLLPALVVAYWLFPSTRQGRRVVALALGFLLVAVPWNAYYSARNGAPFVFQNRVPTLVHRGLNPNAQGYNYPHPKPATPSGLRFVTEMPGAYLGLLARRLTYLSGFERDIWWVAPRGARLLRQVVDGHTARRLNAAAAALLALAGAVLILSTRTRTRGGVLAVGMIAVLLAPHLIVSSSTRFMVPAIPLFTLLQVQAVLFVVSNRRPKTVARSGPLGYDAR